MLNNVLQDCTKVLKVSNINRYYLGVAAAKVKAKMSLNIGIVFTFCVS